MKLTPLQLQVLAKKTLEHWKKAGLVQLKADEKEVLDHMVSVMKAEIQKEIDLENEARKMVDQLERSHSGQFERHKMYVMVKNKLAKDKKIIL